MTRQRPIEAGVRIKALADITSDGFPNLNRVDSLVLFDLDNLPTPPPIFQLIQSRGSISPEQIFLVFNMGVGFVAVVATDDEQRALSLVTNAGYRVQRIGTATPESEKTVYLRGANLVGRQNAFSQFV